MKRPLEEDGTLARAWHGIRHLNPELGSKDRATCIEALQCPLLRWISGDLDVDTQVSMILRAAHEAPKVHNFKTGQQVRVSKITKHWSTLNRRDADCEQQECSTSIRENRSRQMELVQSLQRANGSPTVDPSPEATVAAGGVAGTNHATTDSRLSL